MWQARNGASAAIISVCVAYRKLNQWLRLMWRGGSYNRHQLIIISGVAASAAAMWQQQHQPGESAAKAALNEPMYGVA